MADKDEMMSLSEISPIKQQTSTSQRRKGGIFSIFNVFQKKQDLEQKHKEGQKNDPNEGDVDEEVHNEKEHHHKEKKVQREELDFTRTDQDGRNLLHRAALEQNIQLINDVINEYQTVVEQKHMNEEELYQKIQHYVNLPDKFHLTSIIHSCYLNIELEESEKKEDTNTRYECIVELYKRGADINVQNPRTLWTALYWCAHYGDKLSVEFLLKKGAHPFIPDYKGMYPIDLAGDNEHRAIVEIFLKQIPIMLYEYDLFKKHQLQTRDDDKFIYYQDMLNNFDKYLCNPLLKCKLLYWCCHYNFDISILRKIYSFPRVYYNSPLFSFQMMTPVHAASQALLFEEYDPDQKAQVKERAQKKSITNISFMLDKEFDFKAQQTKLQDCQNIINKRPNIFDNCVYSFSKKDIDIYRKCYFDEVMKFAKWEKEYLKHIQQFLQQLDELKKQALQQSLNDNKVGNNEAPENNNSSKIIAIANPDDIKYNILLLNQQDLFGNTPLHLASLKGNSLIVTLLLDYGADMNKENKEFFKARELTQNEDVAHIYHEKLKTDNKVDALKNIEQCVMLCIDEIQAKEAKEAENARSCFSFLSSRNAIGEHQTSSQKTQQELNYDEDYQKALKNIFLFSDTLFVPDFVIKCRLKQVVTDDCQANLFNILRQDNAELQRLNFQISMLLNARFEIYLMKSYFEKGFYYIMLRHKENNLEQQAQIMQLQVKLMDRYDLEPFQIIIQDLFEPFRSRQRQEIIENHVKRIMNLDQLIRNKVVEQFYRMHTYGGIERIKFQWITKSKWYWPQPLNQIDDYLFSGENQNFTTLTTMRLYLGEKISFYFAWKSYLTCILLFIAIPGAVLQAYILITGEFESQILPYWVFYVCIWSTVQVELWKRKSAEINTRWGCIDLMEDEEAENRIIREGFSGDEEIYDVTGELTKYQEKAQTIFILLVSIPILTIFVAMSIGIFLGVQYLLATYAKNDPILSIVFGVLQGLGITILNIIYTFIANWFADHENHKYQGDYDSSLIYKNMIFKFINSYLSIYYNMFDSTKSLEQIFYLMLPVLIVKQFNYMLLEVFLPQLVYKRKEEQYFKKINTTIKGQSNLLKQEKVIKEEGQKFTKMDPIETFWKARLNKQHSSSSRAVIKIPPEEEVVSNLQSDIRLPHETDLDVDAVELNALKLDFEGTLNYFMEGMIDYGYFTLFAAAFPIGPAIATLVSIPEIRMKIFSFLYVYKRPTCQRSAGIGEYLNVIEMMSVFSVFSNFALLYFKHKQSTVAIYQSESLVQESKDLEVWFFLLSIGILMILKEFFKDVIPDKPEWVVQEIEKMKHKEAQQSGKKTADELRNLENHMQDVKKEYSGIYHKIKKKKTQIHEDVANKNSQIEKMQLELERLRKANEGCENNLKGNSLMQTIGKNKNQANEYDMIMLGVLRQKYSQLESQIILKRLGQIEKHITQLVFVCQECAKTSASLDCCDCDENFCLPCFRQIHTLMVLSHKVRLINDVTTYDPEDVKQLTIISRPSDGQKQKFKFTKEDKSKVQSQHGIKVWKKFEYFSFPSSHRMVYFQYLEDLFKLFLQVYIIEPGFEYRNYEVNVQKIFAHQVKSRSKVSSKKNTLMLEQTKQNDNVQTNTEPKEKVFHRSQLTVFERENEQIQIEPSSNLHACLLFPHFNIEDKLFLNRLAFLTFKRLRHLSNFKKFSQYCSTLQDGLLEQRVLLLIDLIDISDDNEISKVELERIFIPSIIQDMTMQKSVSQVIQEIFPIVDQDKISKKELTKFVINQCQEYNIKGFLQALVQDKD